MAPSQDMMVGAAAADLSKPPSQDMMVGAEDIEMSPPAQRVMQCEAEHFAGPEQYTQDSDQLASKCICWKCGIGEVLGNTVCGQNCTISLLSVTAARRNGLGVYT